MKTFIVLLFLFNIIFPVSGAAPDANLGKSCTVVKQVYECGSLVCLTTNQCGICNTDSQCQLSYSKFVCVNGACKHKSLFPMELSDVLSTIFAFLIISMASGGGGIGGGGALVPLYVLVAGFKPGSAIPLSKATIFGGAVANLIMNLRKRHPTAERPMIDYQLVTLFVPSQLLGTMVGVLCNKTWPNWLIVVCLIVFLFWLTRVTYNKGLIIYENETGKMLENERVILANNNPSLNKSPQEIDEERKRHLMSVGGEELQKILKNEKTIPFRNLLLLFGLWLLVVFIALIKGGEGASLAGVKCASATYWLLYIIPFFVILTIVMLLGRRARTLHEQKLALGYHFHPGDVHWNARNTLVYPLLNLAVGFGSGALGIGGGTMTGPLMLHLQMNTQVVTATAAFMILFTSSITSAQFIIYGTLEPVYGAWFASFGFFASLLGQTVMSYVLRKYKRQSIVVFCITGILGLSGILLGFQGIQRVVLDLENQVPMGFRPLCENVP